MSSLHLPLLSAQIYTARLHVDFSAGTHYWEKLGWICPGVRLGQERGRQEVSTTLPSYQDFLQPKEEEQRSSRQLRDLPGQGFESYR